MTSREELFEKLFLSFRISLNFPKCELPRKYLKLLGLDWNKLQIGFNSGQFHHRQSNDFKKPYIRYGILKESKSVNIKSPGTVPYKCFGANGVIFPLHNKKGGICNFFAIRIKLQYKTKEYLNLEGLYPSYPPLLTKKLYILSNVIEAASFIQAGIVDNKEAVLALHDGEYLPQHYQAIKSLAYLDKIIKINC